LELDKKEEDPYRVFIGASLGSLSYCWRDTEVRRRVMEFLGQGRAQTSVGFGGFWGKPGSRHPCGLRLGHPHEAPLDDGIHPAKTSVIRVFNSLSGFDP
jgi:hypothetical protein